MIYPKVKRLIQKLTKPFIRSVSRKENANPTAKEGISQDFGAAFITISKMGTEQLPLKVEVVSSFEKVRVDSAGVKDPEIIKWIETYFSRGDVFYDVGANIGMFSIFAAKFLRHECTVYAFEPEALNFAKLNKNIFFNQMSSTIVSACVAITNEISFGPLYIHPQKKGRINSTTGLLPGTSLHSFKKFTDYTGNHFDPVHQQGVIGVTLDSLWQTFDLSFPSHVKIDVDGLEKEVIEGAKQTLKDERLKSVMLEICPARGYEDYVHNSLNNSGFELAFSSQDATKLPLKVRNELFLRARLNKNS